MLARVWRKGNPLTVLVGMQTSTATMENNVEIPLKTGDIKETSHARMGTIKDRNSNDLTQEEEIKRR